MYQGKTMKEKLRLLLIMVALALSVVAAVTFSACEKGVIIGERSYWVAGIITDSLTKQPIDSVMIWWHDTLGAPPQHGLSYSDTLGRYCIGVPEGGTRKISAAKLGYVTKTVSAEGGRSPDTVRINMELARQD